MGEKTDVAAAANKKIAEQVAKDEKALDAMVKKAQLLQTSVPPPEQWRTCWACGKKVPIVTRDPIDGTLVCRTCFAIAQVASTAEDIGDLLEAISAMLAPDIHGGVEVDDDDDEHEDEEPTDDGENDNENDEDNESETDDEA